MVGQTGWPVDEYWNHNTAYHAWLIDITARHRGHVLDVGCGEGLLVRRLGVPVANPCESLGEIRQVAEDVLPSVMIRCGLYYRYRLHWRNA